MTDLRDNHVIIDAAVPFGMLLRNAVLTFILWFIYLYLIQDSFAFMSDVISWMLNGLGDTARYASFKIMPTMASYAEIIIILGFIFIGWALYNQARFRGKNKRKSSPPVTAGDLAAIYHLTAADVGSWQNAKSLIVHHDNDGNLVTVRAA